MRCLLLLVGLCLAGAANAQVATVVRLQDIAEAMAAKGNGVDESVGPIARLARLAMAHSTQRNGQWRAAKPLQRGRVALFKHHPQSDSMLVSGYQRDLDLINSIVAQLRKPEGRQLRLQCTLVRMSEALADEHGLLVNRAVPATQVRIGKVQKAAILAKGSLQNLPEVLAVPLVPFRFERSAAGKPDGKKPVATPPVKQLRLRGEAVLQADDEAIFCVQLAADLPKDATKLPAAPFLACSMPLSAGAGVIMRSKVLKGAPKSEAVVAVWLRFVQVVKPKPAAPKPDSGK